MTTKSAERSLATLPMDALAEDLFGLNLRGLRSVRVLWARPKRYFAAAKALDWNDRYTPSIRLWLSFFALYSLLKVWWIGGNVGMIGAYAAGFAQSGLPLPEGMTFEDVGKETVLLVFGLVPVLQIFSMVALSLVYPFWGEPTTTALRQRYLFATIVPSASLMPVFMTIMVFVPGDWLAAYGAALAIITFLIHFQTGYRGGYAQVTGLSKLWRAGLLAAIVVALNVACSIVAQIAGILLTAQKYGAVPAG